MQRLEMYNCDPISGVKCNLEDDGEPTYALKRPKKLYKYCADVIADMLISSTQLTIQLLFAVPTSHISYISNTKTAHLLSTLRKIKDWYWIEAKSLLGHSKSSVRSMISLSILNIQSQNLTLCRERMVFDTFINQVLFSVFVGGFPTMCSWPVNHLTQNLELFFNQLGPFELSSIQDSYLIFGEPNPLPTLISNVPALTSIFLSNNLSWDVLDNLRKYCKHIEIIEMDVNAIEPIAWVEEYLYRTFFGDLKYGKWLEKAKEGKNLPKSFPKLRDVYIFSYEDYACISPELMFLLQYSYPGIRVRWRVTAKSMIKMNDLGNTGLSGPPFDTEKNNFRMDVLNVRVDSDSTATHLILNHPKGFFKANYLHIMIVSPRISISQDYFVSLIQKYECNKLCLENVVCLDIPLAKALCTVGPSLSEVYLIGYMEDTDDYDIIMEFIKFCRNVKVLSLQLELRKEESWTQFMTFSELETLSLNLSYTPHPLYENDRTTVLWVPQEFQRAYEKNNSKPHDFQNVTDAEGTRDSGFRSTAVSDSINIPQNQVLIEEDNMDYSNELTVAAPRIRKIVHYLDIAEEKMYRFSPLRNGKPEYSDYEKFCRGIGEVVTMTNNLLYHGGDDTSGSSSDSESEDEIETWSKEFIGPRDMSFIFSEIRSIKINISAGKYRYGQFGYGFYGTGNHGVGFYGYGVDGYGFYGDGVYGYGFYGYGKNGYGFYGTGSHGCGFYGCGKAGYGLYKRNFRRGFGFYNIGHMGYSYYPHPKSSHTSQCTMQSCTELPFHASRYHSYEIHMAEKDIKTSLETEALNTTETDMDWISKLLLIFFSETPNLKTLELTRCRLQDLKILLGRGYLNRIRTLKISNTFSKELVAILEAMPSLSLLIIDSYGGMSNYIRFRHHFRLTDLRVEFYDTLLVYPRSALLEFDRACFEMQI